MRLDLTPLLRRPLGQAFLVALLVAQSRVEAGFHSSAEVVAGALLGSGVTILLFQIWG
jgi:membrane-associated phospholipid phosphatase